MKLKSLLFICCFGFLVSGFAESSRHAHPEANSSKVMMTGEKRALSPAYCEIELINDSYTDVRVYGTFDDGSSLIPFYVYSFGWPQYISLYYYGYCHAGMNLYVETIDGYPLHYGYTPVYSTIHIVPYLNKQVKAEIHKK